MGNSKSGICNGPRAFFLISKTREANTRLNDSLYKVTKKVAKKAIAVAKSMTYDRLHHKLETKEWENEVFKLTRAKERKTRDLGVVRCIKHENCKVLSKDADIKKR